MARQRPQDLEREITAQGRRFRKERLRMHLSPEKVASICGCSASAVFAWEAGRSRIPLIAMERLWPHGFDAESVIAGATRYRTIPRYPAGQEEGFLVPEHLLNRYGLDRNTAYVYHNQAFAEGLYPAGMLLAVQWFPEDCRDILEEGECTLLMEVRKDRSTLICKSAPARKGSVQLSLGDHARTVKTDAVLKKCRVIGEIVFPVEPRLPDKPAPKTHLQLLKAVFGPPCRHGRTASGDE